MNENLTEVAERCLRGAEDGSLTFPDIVGTLTRAGFDGYAVDFRRDAAIYYLPDGDSAMFSTPRVGVDIAAVFDVVAIKEAIGEAQTLAAGYTYRGFCRKVAAAGCAGYMVSFAGRRALYYGRDAATHVELFPD